jgi:ADP-ribose pyrophosphatase
VSEASDQAAPDHAAPDQAALDQAALDDAALIETTIARRTVHAGRFIRFRVDTIRGPDGRQHQREIVDHPGAVAIVPLDGSDLLLVRQYRTAAQRVLLEIPAGTLDRRVDGAIEPPDEAAPRELAEETGYTAGTWRRLGRFWTAPGFASEAMTLYLATDLQPVEDYAGPEEDEHLRLVRLPWPTALAQAEAGEIEDAKTLIGIFWLARLGLPRLGLAQLGAAKGG